MGVQLLAKKKKRSQIKKTFDTLCSILRMLAGTPLLTFLRKFSRTVRKQNSEIGYFLISYSMEKGKR